LSAAKWLVNRTEDGVQYSYGYDRRGNLIKEHRGDVQTRQYIYDATNHMTMGKNLENGTQTEYAYNALYMRIRNIQTIAREDGFHTREVSYLPDFLSRTDNELMAFEKGKYSLRTVFGRGYERLAGIAAMETEAAGAGVSPLEAQMPRAAGVELPGAEAVTVTPVERLYFQSDFYGSPLFASNGQGQVLRYAERSIWGDLKQPADSSMDVTGLEENLRFTSYGFDPVIGKHFAKARFYDSGLGRMLAEDPVKRGLNGYSYCDSDPVNYTDPTGEIFNILAGGSAGPIAGVVVGGVFGFGGSALFQILSGEEFNVRKAIGAAANGAIVGGVRGALIGSGVGAGAALAADFGAGTLGSAAEQLIVNGRVSAKESLKDGLINAVTGKIYGNGKIESLGEALVRGSMAGGASSGLNYLSDAFTPRPGRLGGSTLNGLAGMMLMGAGSAFGRDPRRGCGTGSREVDWIGERMAYGYQYGLNQTAQKKSGFNLADFGKEMLVGAITGGLASAAFYGAGKAVEALRESIRSNKGGTGETVYIPSDSDGNPIPLNKQKVNGQDIPLPDPAAEGRPHTVLGGKVSSETGEIYRQSATFPGGTWPTVNGHDVPWSEVHWTDHGTPYHHTNPHQHIFEYNPDKGGWIRKGPTIL